VEPSARSNNERYLQFNVSVNASRIAKPPRDMGFRPKGFRLKGCYLCSILTKYINKFGGFYSASRVENRTWW